MEGARGVRKVMEEAVPGLSFAMPAFFLVLLTGTAAYLRAACKRPFEGDHTTVNMGNGVEPAN